MPQRLLVMNLLGQSVQHDCTVSLRNGFGQDRFLTNTLESKIAYSGCLCDIVHILVSLSPDLPTSHSTGCIASHAGDVIQLVLWEGGRSGDSETTSYQPIAVLYTFKIVHIICMYISIINFSDFLL